MRIAVITLFLSLLCRLCLAQNNADIRLEDGTELPSRYCYGDVSYGLSGIPAGGTFAGCGVIQKEGRWVFNPVTATQGITVFPYQCILSYTVNGMTVQKVILVQKPLTILLDRSNTATCDGSFTLWAEMLYAGAYDYSWQPAALLEKPDSSYSMGHLGQTQEFIIAVRDRSTNCTGSDTITVQRRPQPELIVLPADTTIIARTSIQYRLSGAAEYWWHQSPWISNTRSEYPVAYPQASVQYTIIGKSEYGCLDTAYANVTVKDGMQMPNAFTPNGDGLNDEFKIANYGYQGVEVFRIFDRWGRIVFETTDGSRGWDGTVKGDPAPSGNYIYHIRLRLQDGVLQEFKGDLTLIR
ncbi:gliding motility-associated C-terminal domain-containing protein [Edaphocola aurantiacus]|uniref:gliding motility-associated C-terminal domain-containing protein n=1 Tax=Edaphocola aurantiacus TaxID=2601682 RepID=UPI001C96A50E|nr:gliding motility-associated C-terminal domain-containing protein [Edaphocola aurantiacus]